MEHKAQHFTFRLRLFLTSLSLSVNAFLAYENSYIPFQYMFYPEGISAVLVRQVIILPQQ